MKLNFHKGCENNMDNKHKYDSVIVSINITIGNMEENLRDCKKAYQTLHRDSDAEYIKALEGDIELHKGAIIALQMVASGKLRVI